MFRCVKHTPRFEAQAAQARSRSDRSSPGAAARWMLCAAILLSACADSAQHGESSVASQSADRAGQLPVPAGHAAVEAECSKTSVCNSRPCSVQSIPGSPILASSTCTRACCVATGNCGLALDALVESDPIRNATACIELAQPGRVSSACPSYVDAFNADHNLMPSERAYLEQINFTGCCRPDRTCGFMVDAYGLGCASNADMVQLAALVPGVSQLPPRTCAP
jgi:hypothetical protein